MLGAFIASVVAVALGPPALADEDGPPLEVAAHDLAGALSCPAEFVHPEHDPVLLVHGTNVTASEHWSWNYGFVLPQLGYDTCLVQIPGRERGDIQVSSEYVVAAVRRIAELTGRRVDVIGHSQGTLEPRWAMKWWPDVAEAVDDYVSLAGPHHGILSADLVCVLGSCFPSAWQMKQGSAFIGALNRGSEAVGGVSMTSIYSETDDLVQPYETSMLDGATNIAVQDLCPGRPVDHIALAYDAVAFALTIDALDHPGPADAGRSGYDCSQYAMSGVSAFDIAAGEARLYGNVTLAFVYANDNTDHEPDLKAYAR
jgi:triacylglycerol esterase/lipase EstA (alpha/beta hydrolase family)